MPESWRQPTLETEDSADSLRVEGDGAMKERKYWQAIKK